MPHQDTWKKTACILCSLNCGLEVQTGGDDGRRIVRIRGDKAHPNSKGYLCEKAQRLDYYQNAADRLTTPLRRRPDGSYEAVDWDTAIREVAGRFAQIRDRHGGESILFYGGGGQGNHLGGVYADAFLKAIGNKYRSNALAQEKTGEFWVQGKMFGTGIHGDFEHCEVALFLGKNPWQSHGFARARATLRALQKDPNRAIIVIDPRRSETAAMADHHLAIAPGTDAWCLAALVAILVEEELVARGWVEAHTTGYAELVPRLKAIPIARYAAICGVEESQLREVARRIASARSVSVFEDLGVQMNVNSTLNSYLGRLVWLLTGHYGRPGTSNAIVPLLGLSKASKGNIGASDRSKRTERRSPVANAKIIIGLIPCNVIPEEILTDHPRRYRAMLVHSGNPVHSLADSERMREAMRALDFSVVVDVAMTETARLADYVLPAASQFEKPEATFFNVEFPRNAFHLRQPLFDPYPGTLPEAELYARLVEELGELSYRDYRWLRRGLGLGRTAFTLAFLLGAARNPGIARYAAIVLYRTLGPTLARGMAPAAVLWGLAQRYVKSHPEAAARAGFGGLRAGERLFEAIMSSASGVVYADSTYEESWRAIGLPGGRINLVIPELLTELQRIDSEPPRPPHTDPEFPLVLSAGERRSTTSNTAIRDASWHQRGRYGTLRISAEDADALGCEDGDRLRLSTPRGSLEVVAEISAMMRKGHISLPNGHGIDYDGDNGQGMRRGVPPNELTDSRRRDPIAGTPWHKHVPARLEPLRMT